MKNFCPKHGSELYGFAFACEHLIAGTETGFNTDPTDPEESTEERPAAWCNKCETRRLDTAEYHAKRLCAVCYDEIKKISAQNSNEISIKGSI
jgi:hypothetical protein